MNKHLRFSGSTFSKLEEHGVSASTVLRRAGLPQEYAKQPVVRLKTEELFALWRAIGEVSTNSAIGLLLGTENRTERFHPIGLAALSSENFGAAMDQMARYKQLTCPEEILQEKDDEEWSIQFRWLLADEVEPPVMIECAFAWVLSIARHGTGTRLSPLRVEFVQARSNIKAMERHFGCPVLCGGPRNAIVFRAADAERKFVTRNAELLGARFEAGKAFLPLAGAKCSVPAQCRNGPDLAAAPERPRTGSKRLRRVTWTASTFVVLVLIGALVAWRIRKENTPEEYTPGEASKDITSALSKPAAQTTPVPLQTVKNTVSSRVVDRLVDPGRNLPPGAPEPRFTDVTNAAGLASFRQFQGTRTSQLPEDMGSGVAWGDFDNDGLDDLFVVSGGGSLDLPSLQRAPSMLYHNLGVGRFERVQDFPDLRIIGMGAAWGDYNNDGWLDLVVTGYDTIILFRNDHGHLVRDKSFPSPKGFWTGVSWGDYNRDGYLDLYVCGYVKYKPGEQDTSANSTQFGLEVPFTLNPASYEPERNLLFRNNGNGTFTEVAQDLGVANPEGRNLSALWHDFDGDGWPDLYVANDISENKLYLNHHGTFVDAGRSAWVEEYRGSMGLAAGDFDRDGDDDLFISHWIAQGFALYQSLLSEQKGMANGSELHFTDVAANMGIGQPSLQVIGWGTSFVDFDSDGWPDLMVANGSTFEQKETSPRRLTPMPSFLFWNTQGSFFYDLAPWNRSFSQPHVSRGLAVADYNNDGAMDVAIVDQGEGVRLLRNDIPQGNWAEFRLHSRVPPTGAPLGLGDGATVIAWTGKVPIRRTVGSSSYLSQDSHRVHIGLGAATKIDRLEVHWLRGRAETWTNLAANNIWEITQGESEAKPSTPHPANLAQANPSVQLDRAGLVQFWEKQHSAMDAMKRERDFAKAAQLFREALAMNPGHEDSHYYLANCLAAMNDIPSAIAELDTLARINPQNHRAFQRKGELLAASASSKSQLDLARRSLDAALRLNSEETGTLVLLGQVALAQGDFANAEQRFAHACQANPRAVNVWFLHSYIAWKQRDLGKASVMLDTARNARGRDWKPAGSALEGDVQHRMYSESGFLNVFEQQWDGSPDPTRVFAPLDAYLRRLR